MAFVELDGREGFGIWSWKRKGSGGGLSPIYTGRAFVTELTARAAKNATSIALDSVEGFDLYKNAYINAGAAPGDPIQLAGEVDVTAKTATTSPLPKAIPNGTALYTAPLIGYDDTLDIPEIVGKSRVEVRAICHMSFTDGFDYVNGSTGSWLAPDDAWYETLGNFTSWYQDLTINLKNEEPGENESFYVGVVHRNQVRVYGAAYIALNPVEGKLFFENAAEPSRGLDNFIPAISSLLILAA